MIDSNASQAQSSILVIAYQMVLYSASPTEDLYKIAQYLLTTSHHPLLRADIDTPLKEELLNHILCLIAQHQNADLAVIEQLLQVENDFINQSLISIISEKNFLTPEVLLQVLSRENYINDTILFNIANHPNANSEILNEILSYEAYIDDEILLAIAQHPNANSEILNEILSYEAYIDDEILLAIANHPHANSEVLNEILGYDAYINDEVLLAIAQHPQVTRSILLSALHYSTNKISVLEIIADNVIFIDLLDIGDLLNKLLINNHFITGSLLSKIANRDDITEKLLMKTFDAALILNDEGEKQNVLIDIIIKSIVKNYNRAYQAAVPLLVAQNMTQEVQDRFMSRLLESSKVNYDAEKIQEISGLLIANNPQLRNNSIFREIASTNVSMINTLTSLLAGKKTNHIPFGPASDIIRFIYNNPNNKILSFRLNQQWNMNVQSLFDIYCLKTINLRNNRRNNSDEVKRII
jgi:hypothetical protein